MVLSNAFYYERIQLDTINERFNKVPTAKEGDANGRGMIVVLTENGLVKNTTGVSLLFKWEHTRISGAQGLEDFEPLDLTKGEYIVTYPAEMNHEGYVKAEIRIIDNGKYAGSRNMKIQVEPSVGDDTAMESSNQFSALVTALLQVNSWNTTIDGKIVDWEADMAATKQLYIDNMEEVESTYPTRLVSVEQQLAEIVPLKPNGVDDTQTIQNLLNSRGYVELGEGTFNVSNLLVEANKTLIGQGVGVTTIKQKANTNSDLINIRNATNSLFSDMTLDGNKANNVYNANNSVLRIDTTSDYPWHQSNFNLTVERVVIKDGASNGLTSFTKKTSPFAHNWIYRLRNIVVKNCDGYGFWDNTTDNRCEDFLLSYNRIANMYVQSGNNMYVNFKLEGGGKTETGDTQLSQGRNFIFEGSTGCQFTNFDCQTGYEAGGIMKNCSNIIFNGSFDSNGEKWNATPETSQGTGLEIVNSKRITGSLVFYKIHTVADVQMRNCYIGPDCSDISFTSESTENMIILGDNCVVSSLSKLSARLNSYTQFIKLFGTNPDRATGFACALDRGLIPDKLITWLNGYDFKNVPPTTSWADRSGAGNVGTPENFEYTTTSGSNNGGGVVFNKTNDLVTLPPLLAGTKNLTISFTVRFQDLIGGSAYAVLGSGLSTTGRLYIALDSNKKPFVQTFFGGSHDYTIGSQRVMNTTDKVNITVTIDREGRQTLYVDGIQTGYIDISSASTIPFANDTVKINPITYSTQSNFILYDLVIYDRVLNAREVKQNADSLML